MAKEDKYLCNGRDFPWKTISGEAKHQISSVAARDGMSFIRNTRTDATPKKHKLSSAINSAK